MTPFPMIIESFDANHPLNGDHDRKRVYDQKEVDKFINRAKNDLENTPGTDIYIVEKTNPPRLYQVTI